MLNWFNFTLRSAILGIDISASSVKILELSLCGEQYCVQGYARAMLAEDMVDGAVIKDIDAVANCIRQLLNTSHFTSKKAAIAIPHSATISKILQVNASLGLQELEEAVMIEAVQFLPYSLEHTSLDFTILGPASKNVHSSQVFETLQLAKSPSMMDVFMVAANSEHVRQRVEVLNRAGLEAKIVDVDCYALERAVQQLALNEAKKTIAIVYIAEATTQLFVVQASQMIFSGEMSLSSSAFKEQFLVHINRYPLDHLLLAGNLHRQPELLTFLQEQLAIPTSIANPLAEMGLSPSINRDLINADAPMLMMAYGLALRPRGLRHD